MESCPRHSGRHWRGIFQHACSGTLPSSIVDVGLLGVILIGLLLQRTSCPPRRRPAQLVGAGETPPSPTSSPGCPISDGPPVPLLGALPSPCVPNSISRPDQPAGVGDAVPPSWRSRSSSSRLAGQISPAVRHRGSAPPRGDLASGRAPTFLRLVAGSAAVCCRRPHGLRRCVSGVSSRVTSGLAFASTFVLNPANSSTSSRSRGAAVRVPLDSTRADLYTSAWYVTGVIVLCHRDPPQPEAVVVSVRNNERAAPRGSK